MMIILRSCWFECKYELKRCIRYKISFISDIIFFVLLFLGLFYMGNEKEVTGYYGVDIYQGRIIMLIGYLYWQLSSIALGISANVIKNEALSGTLEAKLLTRVPCVLLLFARLLAGILVSMSSLAAVIAVVLITKLMPVSYLLRFLCSLLLYFPSLLGMFGIGLLFGGLALKEKSIGQFLFMIQAALLFISNIFSINDNIFGYIIPHIFGIGLARNYFVSGSILIGEFMFYLLLNILWLIVGSLFFNLILSLNKKFGFFSAY